jgi:hypothetical protein
MSRFASGVLIALLVCGMSACGDDDGDDSGEARPERDKLGAAEFEMLCDAVVQYFTVTVPPGTGTENQAAFDALQTLVQEVQDFGAEDRDEESLMALRGCVDDLTNVLQAAASG